MDKVRILVVDDSLVSYSMIEGILSRTKFIICGYAKNAAEAVEKYRELKPDIVTMDMNLPDADGIECSRRILEFDVKAKIIMISAMRDTNLIIQGRAVGISAFLQKPVNASELVETLRLIFQSDGDIIDILQASYVRPFVQSLQKNLFSLAGLHSNIEVDIDTDNFLEVSGIAVIIGLTGSTMGRIVLHADTDVMLKFSRLMLGIKGDEALSEERASDCIEESTNIIAGRGVSAINDIFKDKEMRVTPPGTIVGSKIKIVNPKLTSFRIIANTNIGQIKMNIGFSGGE